jgi:hypothetical protein
MGVGNQKDILLNSIIYHMIFFKAYDEKQLIIDSTLNSSLSNKMNCDRYSQYSNLKLI